MTVSYDITTSELGPRASRRSGTGSAVRVAWPGAAMALSALSGFAGLGYEIVWTQQLGIALGHEFVAVLAVLAAFFAGLGLGSLTLARAIERSARPALWYAACEAVIAAWALALSACMPAAGAWLAASIGPQPAPAWHWAIAFVGPLALLLPATCAMGATLPAIERSIRRVGQQRRGESAIAALYAANTAGAVLGVLGCALWLVPWLGLSATARVCAGLNAACALGACALWRDRHAVREAPTTAARRDVRFAIALCATGVLGIGYEVLIVRVLAHATENTLYTFAISLAVYLLGTALGGAIYQNWLGAREDVASRRDTLLALVAGACLLGAFGLGWVRSLGAALPALLSPSLGGMAAALAGEALLAVAAFLPATLAMGMLFSHLCTEAKRAGFSLGTAIALNTLGAAFAPLLIGVLLVPALGPKSTLLGVVLGYLLLVRAGAWPRAVRDVRAIAAAACGALLFLAMPALIRVAVPDGGRLLDYQSGFAADVSVVEDATGTATLHIDDHVQEGSSATLLADARQAWLPLLLHAHPHRALFLGLGTGLTAGSAAWDPDLQVDAVELLPEVVALQTHFARALGGARAPRAIVADARRYVRAEGPRYDVIVADLFHPARSGAAALFTLEHFAAVRARLADDGLFCQWLPLHQLDFATLQSIVGAFVQVYPDASALLATNALDTPVVGLIGRGPAAGHGFALTDVRRRLAAVAEPAHLSALHLEDELAVLGNFVAGPRALAAFAAHAPLNTDDHPVVAQRAPFATYADATSPRRRLVALLHALPLRPGDVLAVSAADSMVGGRLAAYFAARDRFIEVGTGVRPSADPRAMLAQVRGPLLDILRMSPDFRPAYDPLLNMAAALIPTAAPEARALLAELASAQPARPEAGRLLQRLSLEE